MRMIDVADTQERTDFRQRPAIIVAGIQVYKVTCMVLTEGPWGKG